MKRVEAVRAFRFASKSAPTRKLAETPTRFHVENMPKTNYLLLAEVSSERRSYIPIGFVSPDVLSSNLVKIFPDAKAKTANRVAGSITAHDRNGWSTSAKLSHCCRQGKSHCLIRNFCL